MWNGALVEPQGNGRIILIGASHKNRTAEFLNECISLAIPGFRPEKGKIIEIEERLLENQPKDNGHGGDGHGNC